MKDQAGADMQQSGDAFASVVEMWIYFGELKTRISGGSTFDGV